MTGAEMRFGERWLSLGLVLGCFVIYLATTVHGNINTDVWSANFLSWRIGTTANPWLDGVDVGFLAHDPNRHVWMMVAANGHTVITRAPGVVVVSLPAYFLLHPSHMTMFPGSLTAAALTAGSVLLMFRALTDRLPTWQALVAALAFGFCSPVWSISANGVWPHTVTGLGIAGIAWASATRRWWWAGAFGGIAMWARPHAGVIVAFVGLYLAWRRREPAIALKAGSTAGAFLVALCVWTHWIYGTWNPTGSYDGQGLVNAAHDNWLQPVNQLGMWIAPDRGILVWTPVVLLLLPALVRSWRTLPDWSQALLLAGLLYTFIQAEMNSFTGGYLFYGYRYGLGFLACATPALSMSVPRAGRLAARLLGPTLAVQLMAFAAGAISDGLWLGPQSVWRTNAFVHAVDRLGWPGWVLVAMFAVLGAVTGRLAASHATSQESQPGPRPAVAGLA